ncbi:hypothetical protein BJ970_003421 [Saccharopolyspora phatthalungensis]|uniref:Uncharacterized protein n=1 Tax=Saccharopolyspora phatthalungensis TaxID=664693 RepID=A0A840Q7G8_9PSEU|nr:hypothetical protein [Saccharopolyspora phatthalungensis]
MEIGIGKAEMFAEEGAGDGSGAGFSAEPGFFDRESLGCLGRSVQMVRQRLFFVVDGVCTRALGCR